MIIAFRILGCLFALALFGLEHGRDYGRHGTYIWNIHVYDGLWQAVFTGLAIPVAVVWCFMIAWMIENK